MATNSDITLFNCGNAMRQCSKSVWRPGQIILTIGLVLGCMSEGSNLVAANVVQKFKLASPTPGISQFFGSSVSAEGGFALVGELLGGANNTGAAHLFNTETGVRIRSFRASDASYIDSFGASVAMSGNVVLVGAPGDDVVTPSDVNSDSGSAYLFNQATGQQLFKLTPTDPAATYKFGASVAISGNTAIIGTAFGQAAYFFDVSTGQELRKLTPHNETVGPFAIDGNRAVISGFAQTSIYEVLTGQELFELDPSNPPGGARLGGSVAIDGNRAIVGAFDGDAAYVFDVTTGQEITRLAPLDLAPGGFFGQSVAIEGNLAVVSASVNSGSGFNSGVAYLFDVTTGQQLSKFAPPGPVVRNSFGSGSSIFGGYPNVAISGDKIVVGEPDADRPPSTGYGPGAAYVFQFQVAPEPSAFVLAAVVVIPVAGRLRRRRDGSR